MVGFSVPNAVLVRPATGVSRLWPSPHWLLQTPLREELRREYGKRVSRKKVAALMRKNGLNARGRWKFVPTTNPDHGFPVCDNVLNREFHAERPGEK
jgi:transposase InsO family protein